jgi:hypothetical protein
MNGLALFVSLSLIAAGFGMAVSYHLAGSLQ